MTKQQTKIITWEILSEEIGNRLLSGDDTDLKYYESKGIHPTIEPGFRYINKKPKFPHHIYSAEWHMAAGHVARSHCPPIIACADCDGPVVRGYVCEHCGSHNPERMLTESELDARRANTDY